MSWKVCNHFLQLFVRECHAEALITAPGEQLSRHCCKVSKQKVVNMLFLAFNA